MSIDFIINKTTKDKHEHKQEHKPNININKIL